MQFRSILLKLAILPISYIHILTAATTAPDWIVRNANDGTLRVGNTLGPAYTSVGVSLYPFWVGNLQDHTRRLMLYAQANGLTSFRCVLLFEQVNGQPIGIIVKHVFET